MPAFEAGRISPLVIVQSQATLDRQYLLTPALVLAAAFAAAFVIYCGKCALGRAPEVGEVKHNELLGPFFARFLVWLISPFEHLLIGRVSPNAVTVLSLASCAATGIAVASGHLPRAVWLYVFAGILDVLDGRLARHAGKPTASGAMFDSVSDRWGEWFVFTGYAWLLRDSAWLLAVMGATGGSMMVSYTRARAEGLGLQLAQGIMQRAERIVLVTGGTLLAAWYSVDRPDAVAPILGVTMLVCGAAATATALHRWRVAHRELAGREAMPAVVPLSRPRSIEPRVTIEPRAAVDARVARALELDQAQSAVALRSARR
jgi:phosphatidylglycerophosphate synthase